MDGDRRSSREEERLSSGAPVVEEMIMIQPVQVQVEVPALAQTQAQGPPAPESSSNTAAAKKEKGRVRFNSNADLGPLPSTQRQNAPKESLDPASQLKKPRPSLLRANSSASVISFPDENEKLSPTSEEAISARAAQERARLVAATVLGSHSEPSSRRNSLDFDTDIPFDLHNRLTLSQFPPVQTLGLPLASSQLDGPSNAVVVETTKHNLKTEAYNIVRSHTQRNQFGAIMTGYSSGRVTPMDESSCEIYVPPPREFRGSILYNLLKLQKQSDELPLQPPSYPHSTRSDFSGLGTPGSSGTATPTRKKWYDKDKSTDTLANLVEASARLESVGGSSSMPGSPDSLLKPPKRPKYKRSPSSRLLNLCRPRMEDEIRITINIAETLSRQKYIIKMCQALMMYGAPTHRLEEYLTMTARVLEIDGQFLYLPGCMIISFDDKQTHTTEVKIVRTQQGIDLGKLKDIHEVYKSVLHDLYGADEAIDKLSAIMAAKDKFPPWLRVLVFGLASASVAPFAFGGRWIDLPFCFFLGSLVGALQIIVAPKSALYNNLFEVSATILTSFLARAFGSIRGGELFCFSAMAQSSIALILPGWIVLSSALELQSRALVPGSIRLVYAIIYSLFIGFGITLGTVLYGLIDPNATSATSCSNTMDPQFAFIFVPIFTFSLAVVNQAKWKQLPVMIVISFAGYIVNFFSSPNFTAAPQIANTLGAFTVGVLANLYSRLRHGVAAAALLPAIFVQVPSGLAATGSLLSGVDAANRIKHHHAMNGTAPLPPDASGNVANVVFNVAGSMIHIALGITLGLFLSALVVYPFGKRRSGLWSL